MVLSLLIILYISLISFCYGFSFIWLLNPHLSLCAETQELPIIPVSLLGLGLLVSLVNFISLVMPINMLTHIILIVFCIVLLILTRKSKIIFSLNIKSFIRDTSPMIVVMGGTWIVYLLASSIGPGVNYDTGLYHAQAMQWMEKFYVIPGLGNLHGRLAFNSSWVAINAFFNAPFREIGSVRVLNTWLMICAVFLFTGRINKLLKNHFTLTNLVTLLMAFFMLLYFPGDSSYGTDLPGTLFCWFAVMFFLVSLEDAPGKLNRIFCLFFICTAVTIKLSNLPFLLLLIPIYFVPSSRNRKDISFFLGGIFLIFFPWIVRNIILSGCLVYPVPFLRIPWLDWAMPRENIQAEYESVKYWARIPWEKAEVVASMPFKEWFLRWYHSLGVVSITFLLVGFLGNLTLFIMNTIAYRRSRLKWNHDLAWINLTFALSMIYWFFNAPDLRFSTYFLIPAFGVGAYPLFRLLRPIQWNLRRFSVISGVALFQVIVILFFQKNINAGYLNYLLQPCVYPEVELVETMLSPNISVYQPSVGNQCWDAPIPCTPIGIENLELRGETLQGGFRYKP